MVLLVSVLAENWLQVRRALLRGGRPPPGTVGSRTALPQGVLSNLQGRLLRVDWSSRRITHHLPLPSPAGVCWAPDDRRLWVASGRGAALCVLDTVSWKEGDRIRHPGFHDLHSVTRLEDRLLVSSAGTDAVFEFDLDGSPTRAWWATAHGLDRTPTGAIRRLDPGSDHRSAAYASLDRTVHPNGAIALANGHWRVTSFHQGAVLDVQPDGRWRRWATDLDHPHRLKPLPAAAVKGASWLVSDTLRGRVLALDDAGKTVAALATGLRWVQDAAWTREGLVVLDNLYVGPGMRPERGNCILHAPTGVRCALPANWRPVAITALSESQAAATESWPRYPDPGVQRWTVDPE